MNSYCDNIKLKESPFVSIVIPAKNEEQRIGLCLNAIQETDYPNDKVEIILVDNGSVDSTVKIAKTNNIKVIEAPHLSISGLRNIGTENATAEIVIFIDADILVTRNWLSTGIEIMIHDPEINCLGGYINIPSKSTWIEKIWHLKLEIIPDLANLDWVSSMNMFIKKEIFFKIGGFNEKLVTGEDVDFCLRMRKLGKILYSKKVEVVHIGEAKTLKHFFLKERWRGQSNLNGILSHGFHLRELPSIFLPLFYLLFYFIFIPSLIFTNNVFLHFFIIVLFFTIPSARSFLICIKLRRIMCFIPLAFLWWLYYTARGFAFLSASKKRK